MNLGPESPDAPFSFSRLIVPMILVAVCAELGYTIVNISAMSVYIETIGLPSRWIGIVTTAFLLTEGLMKSPLGLLGDRIGRKALIVSGPFISIFTALITANTQNGYMLTLLRVFDGCAAAALWPSAFSLIGDHVPEEKRASAMSFFNISYLVGIALGPLIGGLANDFAFQHLLGHIADSHQRFVISKEASFYVGSALFTLATFTAFLLLPGRRATTTKISDVAEINVAEINVAKINKNEINANNNENEINENEINANNNENEINENESGFNLQAFKEMLARIPILLLLTFITFMSVGLVMAYVKVFLLDIFHITEVQFGKLLIIPALVIATVSVPLGTLGDRIGKANAVRLGIAICTCAFWAMLIFLNQTSLVIMGSLLGIGFVIALPAWMALVSEITDAGQRGAAFGAVGTAQGLGAIAGVLVSALLLYDHPEIRLGFTNIPPHGLPFLGCGIMLLISLVIAMTAVREVHPQKNSA